MVLCVDCREEVRVDGWVFVCDCGCAFTLSVVERLDDVSTVRLDIPVWVGACRPVRGRPAEPLVNQ